MCKESDALGPIVHFPCTSDQQCEKFYGPECKCIKTYCCPSSLFDKIHSQTSQD
ncbi:unnamed protein product [Lupinus luteus]|uniref:WAP domain-containing protein n=1 Tax=Lupinus luteus TaxID=3873 RepID=A0AAV1XHY1_LUPLU